MRGLEAATAAGGVVLAHGNPTYGVYQPLPLTMNVVSELVEAKGDTDALLPADVDTALGDVARQLAPTVKGH